MYILFRAVIGSRIEWHLLFLFPHNVFARSAKTLCGLRQSNLFSRLNRVTLDRFVSRKDIVAF